MPNVRSAQREEDDSARTVEGQREALRQRMREVQAWALALPGQDQAQSVVDELIARRRVEAQREEDAIASTYPIPRLILDSSAVLRLYVLRRRGGDMRP